MAKAEMGSFQKGVDNKVALILGEQRHKGQEVSSAHNESNLRNTALLTQEVGRVYGFDTRTLQLAYIAASFHDIVRTPKEDGSKADEKASAKMAREQLEEFARTPSAGGEVFFETTEDERSAVAFAIENHGKAPSRFIDPDKRNGDLESLEEKLHTALFVADKMTANGFDVMRRRSSFVAGERLRNGDLKEFGFNPDIQEDRLLAVAAESALRLGFINPEEMYPDRLKKVVEPLYKIQREYVRGVYNALGLTNRQIAALLLGEEPFARFRQNNESLSAGRADKYGIPQNIDDLTTVLNERTGITDDDITQTPISVRDAAIDAVEYFSSHYRTDLDELTLTWKPHNQVAKQWQLGMKELIQTD